MTEMKGFPKGFMWGASTSCAQVEGGYDLDGKSLTNWDERKLNPGTCSFHLEIQPVHPKEISPEYSLKGLMLKLKFQYFGHLCEELTHLKRP